jgi:fermentation-respiration switch protein FrsA (DUF1100 family)
MKILLWIAAVAIIFLAGIRYIERHSIYFPMSGVATTPSSALMPYEDVYFRTSDGKRLNGWFVPADGAGFTVLFCHGNAGNISHRIEKISILHGLGQNVFVFDYRGYGNSEGVPSEAGLYKDALAAYNYLTREKKIPADRIILYGESIGSAVIIYLANRVSVRALITEESFTSIKEMACAAYPFIPSFIFSSSFDAVSKIRDIGCDKLIIHSVNDEIVPFSMGKKLFDAARLPKKFLELQGSHNTAFLDSEDRYREGIRSFLNSLEQRSK